MSYVTLEVEIDHGRVAPRGPEGLPDKGSGLLTILEVETPASSGQERRRVELPLIQGDGHRFVDPKAEELDASLWGD